MVYTSLHNLEFLAIITQMIFRFFFLLNCLTALSQNMQLSLLVCSIRLSAEKINIAVGKFKNQFNFNL